jgi:hypothetical protein
MPRARTSWPSGEPESIGDRSLVLHDAAVVAAERKLSLRRREPVDRVEERVEVHEPAELAVRHDLEPELLLPAHDVTHGLVLEPAEARAVLRPLVGEQRGVPGLVDPVHLVEQRPGPLQAADVVGAQAQALLHRTERLVLLPLRRYYTQRLVS